MDLLPSRKVYLTSWAFCLCCFGQAVIPHHTDLHPGRNVYLTSWSIQSVLFLTDLRHLWYLLVSRIPHRMDLHPGRNVYLTMFILSVLQAVRHLWFQHMSGISHHTDLHPGSNIYLTSWFILSVLFLRGVETSVVPTCVRNPL